MNDRKIQDAMAVMTDPMIRRKYRDDPEAAHRELRSLGHKLFELSGEEELKVVFNTADKFYFVLPKLDPNQVLGEQQLKRMQAAGSVGSVDCMATAGSAACSGTF